jgi:hypothetical protein
MGKNPVVLDRSITIPPDVPADRWTAWYADNIRNLTPGVTEIFLHPGYDDGELRAYAGPRLSWGSAWRQRDFDVLQSSAVKDAIAASGAKPITWREIGKLIGGNGRAGN